MRDTRHWTEHAECRDDPDPDVWFPTGHAPIEVIDACKRCPVTAACLQAALEEEGGLAGMYRHGVRGGLGPGARRARWEELHPVEAAEQADAVVRIRAARWPDKAVAS